MLQTRADCALKLKSMAPDSRRKSHRTSITNAPECLQNDLQISTVLLQILADCALKLKSMAPDSCRMSHRTSNTTAP